MVKLFLEYGGQIEIKNRIGMTAMHLAAQSDQILILAFLRNISMNAESLDNHGNTPLHYSAMYSCELATAVLLSWKVTVNTLNAKYESPLHLAVFSGSQRIIRNLLLRGAKVDQKSIEKMTPLELAHDKGDLEIISLLEPPGLLSICGIKPPQRPIRFRHMLMTVYIFLVATGIFSVYWVLEIDDDVFRVLAVLKVLFLILACMKSPGYIKKHHEHKLLDLALEVECFQICPECVTKRLPRSRHCQCCNKCVEKFDHHCPWINNCIGARNLGIFYCYLQITFIFISYTGYLCLNSIKSTIESNNIESWPLFILTITWALIPCSFLTPLFLLIWVQTKNFLTNTTTNERYSRRIETNTVERTDSDSQVDRSNVCRNIWDMCFNIHKQEYKERKATQHELNKRYSLVTQEYALTQKLLNSNSD